MEGIRNRDDAPVCEGGVVEPGEVAEGVLVALDCVDEVQLIEGQVRLVSSRLVEYTEGVVYTTRSKSVFNPFKHIPCQPKDVPRRHHHHARS
jgi:hypothetical protein